MKRPLTNIKAGTEFTIQDERGRRWHCYVNDANPAGENEVVLTATAKLIEDVTPESYWRRFSGASRHWSSAPAAATSEDIEKMDLILEKDRDPSPKPE